MTQLSIYLPHSIYTETVRRAEPTGLSASRYARWVLEKYYDLVPTDTQRDRIKEEPEGVRHCTVCNTKLSELHPDHPEGPFCSLRCSEPLGVTLLAGDLFITKDGEEGTFVPRAKAYPLICRGCGASITRAQNYVRVSVQKNYCTQCCMPKDLQQLLAAKAALSKRESESGFVAALQRAKASTGDWADPSSDTSDTT